jgi:hypothetical protein
VQKNVEKQQGELRTIMPDQKEKKRRRNSSTPKAQRASVVTSATPPKASDNTHTALHASPAMAASTSSAEVRAEQKNVNDKLDFIIQQLSRMDDKFDALKVKVESNEKQIKDIGDQVADNIEKLFELEDRINKVVPCKEELTKLQDQVEDQANRMRRNNIIIHGMPEGSEGKDAHDCRKFVNNFLSKHMKIDGAREFEIERAHRSPTGPARSDGRTRPIFVKFLRYQDRYATLKAAPSLRNNHYRPEGSLRTSPIFISDDVTVTVRAQRKQLVTLKKKLQERYPGKRAFIPPVVPAILLREDASGRLIRMYPGDVAE